MRALFVTSATNDVDSLVRAWDCWQPDGSKRVMFPHMGANKDREIIAAAKAFKPAVIFYIGANEGSGIPSDETLLALRDIAPSINLCCDAADWPWHEPLRRYKEIGAFDLQVALDGNHTAPVDLVTVTPVDPRPFAHVVERTINCGFSGGVVAKHHLIVRSSFTDRGPSTKIKRRPKNALPAWSPTIRKRRLALSVATAIRERIIWGAEADITVRRRNLQTPYQDHADFMLSCRSVINVSVSGTAEVHQIKGRVMEAGWAGCALLELYGSPIADWLPPGSYFLYHDAADAKRLIEEITPEQAAVSAAVLSKYVRGNYHPRQIYGEILERAGIVDHTK